MISFPVDLIFPEGDRIQAGELLIEDGVLNARLKWAFRYTPEYRAEPRAFALDPVALPLSAETFGGAGEPWMPRALNDALPDAWGRRVYARQHGINSQDPRLLIPRMAPPLLGALRFSAERQPATLPARLESLIELAGRIERGEPVSREDWTQMAGTGTAGGARPKALLTDDHGEHWIAKFPSVDDQVIMAPIEALCLSLAGQAGLSVPEHKLAEGRDDVLMVRRFDIAPEGGRYHRISFETLARGQLTSYELGLFLLRRHAAEPAEAVRALFRQMVFNAAIGNTDDHERNFSLLYRAGWQLSPAYDLLPDLAARHEHAMAFSSSNYPPTREHCLSIGLAAGIRPAVCADLVDEVLAAVSGFENGLSTLRCPDDVAERLVRSVKSRIAALRG